MFLLKFGLQSAPLIRDSEHISFPLRKEIMAYRQVYANQTKEQEHGRLTVHFRLSVRPKGGCMKTIDELDLLDDYLNNAVASNKEIGELCYRRVLSVLLQKEIGKLRIVCQRTLPAFLPGLRGIRMDVEIKELRGEKVTNVYDLEPHKQKNLNLPKHNRFYQAKIDSRGLKRGEKDFSKIPNLYVITITNFDPFGYDYMMYTIKNSCVEIPELPYEDGLQFVYFNTKGRKGGSKAIQSMLTYMQDSNEEYAVDEATREVHSYVSRIKSMEEVREGYMTFGDLIDMEREEAANKAARMKRGHLRISQNISKTFNTTDIDILL